MHKESCALLKTSRGLELVETSNKELYPNKDFEMSLNWVGNVGTIEDFEIKKFSNEIARENHAFCAFLKKSMRIYRW